MEYCSNLSIQCFQSLKFKLTMPLTTLSWNHILGRPRILFPSRNFTKYVEFYFLAISLKCTQSVNDFINWFWLQHVFFIYLVSSISNIFFIFWRIYYFTPKNLSTFLSNSLDVFNSLRSPGIGYYTFLYDRFTFPRQKLFVDVITSA